MRVVLLILLLAGPALAYTPGEKALIDRAIALEASKTGQNGCVLYQTLMFASPTTRKAELQRMVGAYKTAQQASLSGADAQNTAQKQQLQQELTALDDITPE